MFQEKSYVWGGNISKQIIRYVTGSVGKCRNELYVIAKFHIIVHEIAKTVYGNLKSAILEKGKNYNWKRWEAEAYSFKFKSVILKEMLII